MEKYIIDISTEAKQDLGNILDYIKNKLLEPVVANKYLRLINEKIKSLEYYPERFGVIDSELIENKTYRKLIIKNYIVIYRVDVEKKTVHIVRVVYGGMDFENLL